MKLTHINEQGRAKMVDVSDKSITKRTAVACATITMEENTLNKILQGELKKGDVLAVSQVAGIQGAKQTSTLIPMCHPLPLHHVDIHFKEDTNNHTLTITATVSTEGKTGVEMEALTCVSIAALTVYDMCKSIDQTMVIKNIYLKEKIGGKSTHFIHPNHKEETPCQK